MTEYSSTYCILMCIVSDTTLVGNYDPDIFVESFHVLYMKS